MIDSSKFVDFTKALKNVARNRTARRLFNEIPEIYQALLGAAKRYIPGETMDEALQTADKLFAAGYQISLEYIGEDTETEKECERVKNNYLQLIEAASKNIQLPSICTDLSNIGLYISKEIARKNLDEMVRHAKKYQCYIMVNMEEPNTTQDVLDLYYEVAEKYDNVGITLQAHLFRSIEDVYKLLQFSGRIRLVKGVFKVNELQGFQQHTEALNKRYLELAEIICKTHHPLSIATQDPQIIDEVLKNNFLANSNTEIEMLHGVTPLVLKKVKEKGYQTRVYLAYGTQWFLHLCHRIAEYPPNIFQSVSDCLRPIDRKDDYYF